jgi:hypothetical protein
MITINMKTYNLRVNHTKKKMNIPILITSQDNLNGFILKCNELININIDIDNYADILKQISDDSIRQYIEE